MARLFRRRLTGKSTDVGSALQPAIPVLSLIHEAFKDQHFHSAIPFPQAPAPFPFILPGACFRAQLQLCVPVTPSAGPHP